MPQACQKALINKYFGSLKTSIRKTFKTIEVLSLSLATSRPRPPSPGLVSTQDSGGKVATLGPHTAPGAKRRPKVQLEPPPPRTHGLMHTHVDTLGRVFSARTDVFHLHSRDMHTHMLTPLTPWTHTRRGGRVACTNTTNRILPFLACSASWQSQAPELEASGGRREGA